MQKFFIDEDALRNDIITVGGGDAVHIGRSLRMKIGDGIVFCREGTEYSCVIEKITGEEVVSRVISSAPSNSEPESGLTIFQALPKGDKAELIIQKCTELGAKEFVFFISKRCVSRPDGKSGGKKLERWQKIAEAAAEQSGRGMIPRVRGIYSFNEALEIMSGMEKSLICYENGGVRLAETGAALCGSLGIMIGSEGGFDRDEVDMAVSKGAQAVWLGNRILRCETCPIAVTAVVMSLWGEI
ncbi:MAG: 16S rRNA (uracil(1498)-N(3))-methyltransferase [Ruminococcus sp.]|nr:16S rRNA (uracil(1498)-N(3))-methyltransferase [Ruminococcus sp.]